MTWNTKIVKIFPNTDSTVRGLSGTKFVVKIVNPSRKLGCRPKKAVQGVEHKIDEGKYIFYLTLSMNVSVQTPVRAFSKKLFSTNLQYELKYKRS